LDIDWVAVYGAVLSTALAVSGLYTWFRRKSEERDERVKTVFRGILGPIRSLSQGLDTENPYVAMTAFLESFRVYKDEILGSHQDLVKLAPDIASELMHLIDIIDKETSGSWKMQTLGIVENQKFKPLLGHLGIDIYDWLSEHQ